MYWTLGGGGGGRAEGGKGQAVFVFPEVPPLLILEDTWLVAAFVSCFLAVASALGASSCFVIGAEAEEPFFSFSLALETGHDMPANSFISSSVIPMCQPMMLAVTGAIPQKLSLLFSSSSLLYRKSSVDYDEKAFSKGASSMQHAIIISSPDRRLFSCVNLTSCQSYPQPFYDLE